MNIAFNRKGYNCVTIRGLRPTLIGIGKYKSEKFHMQIAFPTKNFAFILLYKI